MPSQIRILKQVIVPTFYLLSGYIGSSHQRSTDQPSHLLQPITGSSCPVPSLYYGVNSAANLPPIIETCPVTRPAVVASRPTPEKHIPKPQPKPPHNQPKKKEVRKKPSPFLRAVFKGDSKLVRSLIKSGAPINEKGPDGITALQVAIDRNNSNIVEILVDSGAEIETVVGEKLFNWIEQAIYFSSFDVVKVLTKPSVITPDKIMNYVDKNGNSLLIITLFGNSKMSERSNQIFNHLLSMGIDINIKNNLGNTALMYAASKGFSNIVSKLIAAGATINSQDNDNNTALIAATRNGHTEIVRQLIQAGADLDQKDQNNNSGLHFAIALHRPDLINLYIAAGADRNCVDDSNNTPLIISADDGCIDCLIVLIQADVDLNRQNAKGFTALMAAAQKGHAKAVELLLKAGADHRLMVQNYTAFMLAFKYPAIQSIIRKHIETQRNRSQTIHPENRHAETINSTKNRTTDRQNNATNQIIGSSKTDIRPILIILTATSLLFLYLFIIGQSLKKLAPDDIVDALKTDPSQFPTHLNRIFEFLKDTSTEPHRQFLNEILTLLATNPVNLRLFSQHLIAEFDQLDTRLWSNNSESGYVECALSLCNITEALNAGSRLVMLRDQNLLFVGNPIDPNCLTCTAFPGLFRGPQPAHYTYASHRYSAADFIVLV